MLSKFQILLIAALLTSKSLSLVSEKPNFLSWNIFEKRIAMINNGIPISGEDFYVRLRLSHHWITIQNFCGGTVIDRFWVVTSAACVTYPDSTIFTPDQIKVERGVFGNPATLGNRVVHVNKIVVHPQFKILNSVPIFDIALIRLERAVAKRRVIKLCSEGTDEEMEALNLVSMGSTSTEVFEMPEKLQQTTFLTPFLCIHLVGVWNYVRITTYVQFQLPLVPDFVSAMPAVLYIRGVVQIIRATKEMNA